MARLLIRRATCVFPDETVRSNILIEKGKIVSVDAADSTTAQRVLDADGLHLLPGVIDDQVHFRDPGLTHKEDLHTGSLACAKGGVTTFLEMPNTNPTTTTRERLAEKLALAATKSVVNFGFYIGATADNVDELRQADQAAGIKIFIGSSTGPLLVDQQEALERIFAETTLPICAHCEDEATVRANAARLDGGKNVADHSRIRDAAAALIATQRAIDLAHRHRHRFHVLHVSTAAEAHYIHENHRRLVTAEVCPHHLWFSVEDYDRLGTRVQMNPSIKTAEDVAGLWEALRNGWIPVIATDHAPHLLEEKQLAYPKSPSGLPAVENSLALMLDAVNQCKCRLEQVVDWMCLAPAQTWDLVDKGAIAVGMDADLVLVDLHRQHTIRDAEQVTKCRWSPWDGVTLTGLAVTTIVGGQIVFDQGRLDADHRGKAATFDHARGGYWAVR